MRAAKAVRASLVVFAALVFQFCVLNALPVSGAHADVMLLLPVAAGYLLGPARGATFGFVVGVITDLLLPTTFGMTALVGCVLGYLTGRATSGLVRSSPWLPPLVFATATAAGLTGYAILGSVLDQSAPIGAYLPRALIVAVPVAAVLALPVLRAVAWALTAGRLPAAVGGPAKR